MMKNRRAQSGNIFFMLFASVALVGAFTVGAGNIVKGLVTSMSDVTRNTVAEEKMMSAARLSVMASTQVSAGDCDADQWVEPLPYTDAGANTHPVGGGYVPADIGISVVAKSASDADKTPRDPWGTPYGYCVWDPGPVTKANNNPGCGGSGALRLNGSPHTGHTVVSIISAGKDRKFSTTCADYADVNMDDNPDTPLVSKTAGSDDIILEYTYDDASGLSGDDLWKISDITPDTAVIDKNIDVTGGAVFEQGALNLMTQGLILPGDTETGICDGASDRQLRVNYSSSPPVLEICDFTGAANWIPVTMGGGGGGGAGGYQADITTGLIGHWTLDETSGTTAIDSSSGAHNGTYQNITPASATVPGKVGTGMKFNGTTSSVNVGNNINLTGQQSFTLSTWINFSAFNNVVTNLIDKSSYFLIWGDDQTVYKKTFIFGIKSGGSSQALYVDRNMLTNTWYHLAGVHDTTANTLTLYLNGVQFGTTSAPGAIDSSGSNLLFGDKIDGSMDDIRIYDRALSAHEIRALYSLGGTTAASICDGVSTVGGVCADGTVYAGSIYGQHIYTTRCDYGKTWNGTTCTGSATLLPFNNGNASNTVFGQGTSTFDGKTNTNNLIAIDSDSATAGTQPHQQAQACADLVSGGHSDWYMPSGNETVMLYQGRAAIGNFNTSGVYYSTSTETHIGIDTDNIWAVRFSDGFTYYDGGQKSLSLTMRCVRRGASSDASGAVSLGTLKDPWSLSCPAPGNGPAYKAGETDSTKNYRAIWGDGKYIYAAGYGSGLHAVSLSQLGTLSPITSVGVGGTYTSVHGDGKYIYAANYSGNLIAYTFNGTTFTQAGTIAPGGNSNGVWTDGNYIYLANGSNGLKIYRFNGGTFTLVASYDTDGTATSVWGDGKYLYVSDGSGGIVLFRFDGTNITKVLDETLSSNVIASAGDGSYLYVIGQKLTAYKFDGQSLAKVGEYTPVGDASSLWTSGTNIFLGDSLGNVSVLNFNGSYFNVVSSFVASDSKIPGLWSDGSYLYVGSLVGALRSYTGFGCNAGTTAGPSTVIYTDRYSEKLGVGTGGACAIDDGGALWCWGSDTNGGLGNGSVSTASLKYPSRVITRDSVAWKQTSSADDSRCGIKVNGTLWCWGSDVSGQLGNDATLLAVDEPAPVASTGTNIWTKISGGDNFYCGIQNTGQLYCWGKGQLYILGNNSTSDQPVPVAVSASGVNKWMDVSAGFQHTCGITTDGIAWCWGRNTDGRLGNGTLTTGNVPNYVGDPGPWKSISAGTASTCGIKTDGTAWCWGRTADGRLGLGITEDRDLLIPTRVPDPGPWVSYKLSTSGTSGCGIKQDGSLWCWGTDLNGELANGPTDTSTKYIPTRVPDPGPWSTVNVRHTASCGIKMDGSVWCWGSGNYLGDNLSGSHVRHWPSRVAFYPKPSTWQWNDAITQIAATGTTNIILPVGGNSAIGRDGISSGGIGNGFRFDKAGGSVLRQANAPSSLRIETTGTTTASQISLRTTSAATTRSIGIDYQQRALEIGNNLSPPTSWMHSILPKLAIFDTGNVGIGITSGNPPGARLDINGGLKIGNDTNVCFPARAGTIRYVGGVKPYEYCNGSAWAAF